jgi:type IV secretory pathway VirD2 relaxase
MTIFALARDAYVRHARGRADDGSYLVISSDYIGTGLRARAGDLATPELGPRSNLGIRRGLEAEVTAER